MNEADEIRPSEVYEGCRTVPSGDRAIPAGVPCPFCAIQGVRVYPTWRRYWLMPPQLVCPRCSPNWQPPALWRRVVRCFVDWVTGDTW